MIYLTPISIKEANTFVAAHHRHHRPVRGAKFAVAVRDDAAIRGVLIAGRPVARAADDGATLEVVRCCTDGAANAPSLLYGAARRAAAAMGYTKVITYTLPEEGGASLRAAGYVIDKTTRGGSWSRPSRARARTRPLRAPSSAGA